MSHTFLPTGRLVEERAQPVVHIQPEMYERVQAKVDRDARPRVDVVRYVAKQQHAAMVIHVEECDLSLPVTQNHDHCVQEFNHFGQPVYTEEMRRGNCGLFLE